MAYLGEIGYKQLDVKQNIQYIINIIYKIDYI